MKTYIIGSVEDFKSCTKAALISSPSPLSKDLIGEYTEEYLRDKLITYIVSDKDLIFEIPASDEYQLIYNYIIYYNQTDSIGFTDLQPGVDVGKYGIEKIKLEFNITVVNEEIVASVTVNYTQHEIATNSHVSHLPLINKLKVAVDKKRVK